MAKNEFRQAIDSYKNSAEIQRQSAKQQARNELRRENTSRPVKVRGNVGVGKLVVLILIIALMFRVLMGGAMPTFASLLERLRTMPTLVPTKIFDWQVDLGDWGIFDFVKDMLEASVANLGMIFGLISSLINCLPFVWNILMWIFAG